MLIAWKNEIPFDISLAVQEVNKSNAQSKEEQKLNPVPML